MRPPFRGFSAIVYKEFIVVIRDPLTLFFMLFPPLIEMIAFGFALDTDVRHMSTIVLDEDRTVESRHLVEQFGNTDTFRVIGEASSVHELADMIRRGKAFVGVRIPPEFTRDLRSGHGAKVQVLINGSSSTVALSALNTAMALGLRQSVLALLGEAGRRDLPLEIRPQILYNPDMRSPNFFVPGVIGIVLQIATTFVTAMSLVRERERGTLEQLLVSPISRWGLMLGKLVPYLCIAVAMATILFSIMRWVFDIPIVGSISALAVCTVLYAFALLSLGLLVATRAESQMQALQMTMVVLLPSVFFSGFIFPRETMPWIFYAIGWLLPTTYYIELLRAIILRGATLADFSNYVLILAGIGLALFTFCALRFRGKIA